MMGIRFVLACKMFFLCNNNEKDHKSVRFCYFWVKLLSRLESLIVIHYFIMWARQAVKGTLGHLNNLTQQEFAVGLLPTINFRIWKNLLLITYHAKRNIVKLVLCIQLTPREQWAVCARLGNDSRSHQMPLVKVTDWGTNIMCVFQWWGKPESSEEAQGERINSAEKGPAPVGFNPRTLWLWGNSVNNQKFKYSLIAAL